MRSSAILGMAFQILDPMEIHFEVSGLVAFVGMENLPNLRTRPAEIRASYLQGFERHTQWLKQTLTKQSMSLYPDRHEQAV